MGNTINYTAFDFDTIKTELINKLSKEDIFKDYNFSGSNINTLLELVSAVGDLFGFYINMTANESFLQTGTLFENLNKLAQLVGYKVTGYTSSEATLTLTSIPASYNLTTKNNYKISIPKFTRFTCVNPAEDGQSIYFTNTDEIIYVIDTSSMSSPLSGQSIEISIPLVQGNPIDAGSELTYISNGAAFQKYSIPDLKTIEDYLIVTIDNVEWTKVSNMYVNINSTSKVYTTRYNKDKKVEIQFGDGSFGVIPPLDSSIKIRYISSLGTDGNVSSNSITGISGSIYETTTEGITTTLSSSYFTFTQTAASIGGSNPETEENIREKAPAFFRTQNRVVTKQDYEDLIISNFNEYVYKCKALKYEDIFTEAEKLSSKLTTAQVNSLKTTLTSLGLTTAEINNIIYSPQQTNRAIFYNNVYILIVPRFGDTITETLRDKIDLFLNDYKMVTINHVYLDASIIPINVSISYTKQDSTTRSIAEIEMMLRNIVNEYFKKENRNLGELIIHMDLVNSLSEIDGIKTIILEVVRNDVSAGTETNANIQLTSTEFPKLGTLTITQQT